MNVSMEFWLIGSEKALISNLIGDMALRKRSTLLTSLLQLGSCSECYLCYFVHVSDLLMLSAPPFWCSSNLSYPAPHPLESSCSPRLVFSSFAALKGFVPTPEPSSAPALRASTAAAVAAASTALPAGAADEYLNYNMTGQSCLM